MSCLEEAWSIRRAISMHNTWSLWVPLARAVPPSRPQIMRN